jgi:hypothetical protein
MTYLDKESSRIEEVKLKKKSRPRKEGYPVLCKRPKVRWNRAGVNELSLKGELKANSQPGLGLNLKDN